MVCVFSLSSSVHVISDGFPLYLAIFSSCRSIFQIIGLGQGSSRPFLFFSLFSLCFIRLQWRGRRLCREGGVTLLRRMDSGSRIRLRRRLLLPRQMGE